MHAKASGKRSVSKVAPANGEGANSLVAKSSAHLSDNSSEYESYTHSSQVPASSADITVYSNKNRVVDTTALLLLVALYVSAAIVVQGMLLGTVNSDRLVIDNIANKMQHFLSLDGLIQNLLLKRAAIIKLLFAVANQQDATAKLNQRQRDLRDYISAIPEWDPPIDDSYARLQSKVLLSDSIAAIDMQATNLVQQHQQNTDQSVAIINSYTDLITKTISWAGLRLFDLSWVLSTNIFELMSVTNWMQLERSLGDAELDWNCTLVANVTAKRLDADLRVQLFEKQLSLTSPLMYADLSNAYYAVDVDVLSFADRIATYRHLMADQAACAANLDQARLARQALDNFFQQQKVVFANVLANYELNVSSQLFALDTATHAQVNKHIGVIVFVVVSTFLSTACFVQWLVTIVGKIKFVIVELQQRQSQLQEAKRQTDRIVYSLLPAHVARRLKSGDKVEGDYFRCATIMVTDMVNFTRLVSALHPYEVLELLNDLYSLLDQIVAKLQVYKIATLGDSYLVVSGAPKRVRAHAKRMGLVALAFVEAISEFNRKGKNPSGTPLQIRIGLHSGACAGGVVGRSQPRYYLFGRTLEIAHIMEQRSLPQRVLITEATKNELDATKTLFSVKFNACIDVMGGESINTFWLTAIDREMENVL